MIGFIPTVIVTSFSGSSLLFFVLLVDFAQKRELLSEPFLAVYDLKKPGKENFLVFGKSGGSVVLLVDSTVDATRKTSVPHFGQYL